MGQGHAQDLVVAARAGVEVGAVLDRILGIDVGAGLDQRLCRLHLVVMRGDQQRGTSLRVTGVNGGAAGKQRAHACGVAAGRGGMEFGGRRSAGRGGNVVQHGNDKGKAEEQARGQHARISVRNADGKREAMVAQQERPGRGILSRRRRTPEVKVLNRIQCQSE
ncbi:hypothetical protein D9M72_323990 [compost metagenome]